MSLGHPRGSTDPPGKQIPPEIVRLVKDDRSSLASPWWYWESETYGLGALIRRLTRWPRSLPLVVTADHGLSLDGRIAMNEIGRGVPHLTWSTSKAERLRHDYGVDAVAVPHPLTRIPFEERPPARKRFVTVFPPHDTAEIRTGIQDRNAWIAAIRETYPSEPLAVCLHFRHLTRVDVDIWSSQGFQVLTAGNPVSPAFLSRLYSVLTGSEIVVTAGPGSHIYYALHWGVRCHYIPTLLNYEVDPRSTYPAQPHPEFLFGIDAARPGEDLRVLKSLRDPTHLSLQDMRSISDLALGTGNDFRPEQLRRILMKSLARNPHKRWLQKYSGP